MDNYKDGARIFAMMVISAIEQEIPRVNRNKERGLRRAVEIIKEQLKELDV